MSNIYIYIFIHRYIHRKCSYVLKKERKKTAHYRHAHKCVVASSECAFVCVRLAYAIFPINAFRSARRARVCMRLCSKMPLFRFVHNFFALSPVAWAIR